jgi:tRNA threonylcarbamoyl adenosine modification protein (Sua5/YciO/YrdC/YwlC family)
MVWGCDINNPKAVEKIYRLRQLDPRKAQLSMICKDISQIATYAQQIDNDVFRMLKRNLPGPFTFVLNAGNRLPKSLHNRKKTIGVRVPDTPIVQAIVDSLDRPILSASMRSDDDILEYEVDPEEIYEQFGKLVDLVIDGGIGKRMPSTVVDCTQGEPLILREGGGQLR